MTHIIKKIYFVIICFSLLNCKSIPSVIGKWETNYNEKTKVVSEFKKNGIGEVYYYSKDDSTKLSETPYLLKYKIFKENKKWNLKVFDLQSKREILSPLEFKGNDTLITYHKVTNYRNNDTIITWQKDIMTRIN